jgi:hypothetical protein
VIPARPDDRFDPLAARLLSPFDALRAGALRLFARPLAPLIAEPNLRHALLGSASVVAAFALAYVAPLSLLAVGPLLLGVPHLVADVRYLVLRRGLLSLRWSIALVLLALLAAPFVRGVAIAGVALVASGIVARGTAQRRLATALLGALLLGLDAKLGRTAAIVFAHLHNGVALALWWWLRPARDRRALVVPLLALTGAVALLSGMLDPQVAIFRITEESGFFSLSAMVSMLGPVADPVLGVRFVLLFAFGQSVHYLVWLRLVPDDLRGRRAPRSFTASFRALRGDLGLVVLVGTLLVWGALITSASVDAEAAWCAYMRLATFHGPLELACMGLAFAERRAP